MDQPGPFLTVSEHLHRRYPRYHARDEGTERGSRLFCPSLTPLFSSFSLIRFQFTCLEFHGNGGSMPSHARLKVLRFIAHGWTILTFFTRREWRIKGKQRGGKKEGVVEKKNVGEREVTSHGSCRFCSYYSSGFFSLFTSISPPFTEFFSSRCVSVLLGLSGVQPKMLAFAQLQYSTEIYHPSSYMVPYLWSACSSVCFGMCFV
ncbi:hypothetical protein HDV57DRAFT_215489 [Trichoderma longibrachiatum]|uniref:Uncharacterized protein n=1 Tax=Trichoderma longibrachiatum ATCC 18648 TaxID=983965 RepID=A0A2T4C7U0_TRILO|nr:hypothetical protein M440DRAFT_286420 [Trichoderma longibrachiatum ATCC 18648]